MAKRLTDTEIWMKEWFRELPPQLKLLWKYLTDRCDPAGIWQADFYLAKVFIGDDVTPDSLEKFGDRIIKLTEKKYLIRDFVRFQYGNLTVKNRMHSSIVRYLENAGLCYDFDENEICYKGPLSTAFKGPLKGLRLLYKEKEKDKDKEL